MFFFNLGSCIRVSLIRMAVNRDRDSGAKVELASALEKLQWSAIRLLLCQRAQ